MANKLLALPVDDLGLPCEIASNLELRRALRAISANMRGFMRCDAIHVSLPDPASERFRVQALDFPESRGAVKSTACE